MICYNFWRWKTTITNNKQTLIVGAWHLVNDKCSLGIHKDKNGIQINDLHVLVVYDDLINIDN